MCECEFQVSVVRWYMAHVHTTYQQISSKAVHIESSNIFEHHAAAAAAATAKAPPGQHGILMDTDGYQSTTNDNGLDVLT